MATPSKAATPASGAAARRPPLNPTRSQNNTPVRSPSRLTSPSTPTSTSATAGSTTPKTTRTTRTTATATATATTTAPPSARAAVRKSVSMSSSTKTPRRAGSQSEDDARASAAAALEDTREQLKKTEGLAVERNKQIAVLQARLEDAIKEQGKLEESVHEQQERMEELENEKKESIRKRRELEGIYEAEQAAAMKEREDAQAREEELRETIQRLKTTTATQKELRPADHSRSASFRSNASPNPEGGHFAPPASLERSDSRSSSRLVLEKDKIIESLRLEIAEAQIKIVELESIGGGRVQELEKSLMDARMTNARLMEDNESFQLLLAERTINGDFAFSSLLKPPSDAGSRPPSSRSALGATSGSSLADELHSETDPSNIRRMNSEMSALRDQNKALSLYINNIISRLLQHKEFENILDRTPQNNRMSEDTSRRSVESNMNKDLPPPPPENGGQSTLLERATSVMRGRPRPLSLRPQAYGDYTESSTPAMTEDPATAPSIPLVRSQSSRIGPAGHRRANSEWSAATVVNNLYRGPQPPLPNQPVSSGPGSPGMPPARGSSLFSPISANANPAAAARVPSGTSVPKVGDFERRDSMPAAHASHRDSKIGSSRNSIISDAESSTNPSSPPRSTTSSSEKPSGAIMSGNKVRPLRLVQEAVEQEEATKKANRGSWMGGWFNKGAAAGGNAGGRSVSGETVLRE